MQKINLSEESHGKASERQIVPNEEVLQVGDVLFDPATRLEGPGLVGVHQLVCKSISECNSEIHDILFNNFFVVDLLRGQVWRKD